MAAPVNDLDTPLIHQPRETGSAVPVLQLAELRRFPRIPSRNVRACIETERDGSILVDLLNISRGGVCFHSEVDLYVGTLVSIAVLYIEGGQNIFQDGRLVRVQRKPSHIAPGEYAIEFVHMGGMRTNIPFSQHYFGRNTPSNSASSFVNL